MPRMRVLKPDFWSDKNMVKLSPFARLFFMGMWNFALCDVGHLPDDAEELKLKILPVDNVDADALLAELVDLDRVRRMQTASGVSFLWVRNLGEHQKTDARWQPRCPFCKEQAQPKPPAGKLRVEQPPPAPKPSENHAETPVSSGEPQRDSPELTETLPTTAQEGKGRDSNSGTATYVANGRNAREREPAAEREPPNNDPPGKIERAIGFWLSLLPNGRAQPSVQSEVARYIGEAYTINTPEPVVHEALRLWQAKQRTDRGVGPRLLPTLIHQLATGTEADTQTSQGVPGGNVVPFRSPIAATDRRRSTKDDRLADHAALIAELEAETQ